MTLKKDTRKAGRRPRKTGRRAKTPRKAGFAVVLVVMANIAAIALLINLLSIPLLGPAYGLNGASTTDTRPEFSWGGLHSGLRCSAATGEGFIFMLDEDPGFSSPITKEVKGNMYRPEEPLEFGTYYWKVVSPECATSPTGMFTVVSEVAVERDNGWLKNTGNSAIALNSMEAGREPGSSARPGLTGLFLGINHSVEVGGEDVVAEQV